MRSRRRRTYLFWLFLLLTAHSALVGQSIDPIGERVRAGDRVRVTQSLVQPVQLVGPLLEADAHTLTIRWERNRAPVSVPWESVRSLEIAIGRSPDKAAWVGAQRGALAGVAITAVVGAIVLAGELSNPGEPCDYCIPKKILVPAFGITITSITAAGGAMFGVIAPGVDWIPVDLSGSRGAE